MKITFYLLAAFICLTSFTCSENRIVISENEMSSDMFYLDGEIEPYSGICIVPHKDGKSIKEVWKFKEGVIDGDVTSYYINGEVKRKGKYKRGMMSGHWEQWFSNGNPEFRANYLNDSMTGFFKEWYANGNLKEEGQYKMNERVGLWRFFNKRGELMYEKNYSRHADISMKSTQSRCI